MVFDFCVITLSIFSKISAAVVPFVVRINRVLLVTLSNIIMIKEFILVKSESLLPSVAKVLLVLILDTRSTWNNALFSIKKSYSLGTLILFYNLPIWEHISELVHIYQLQQSANCFQQ